MGISRLENEKLKRLDILKETSSADTFRQEARKVLLLDSHLIHEMINLAHARKMHEKKKQGGGRLIANLYQLRDSLAALFGNENRRDVVEKLFHKR